MTALLSTDNVYAFIVAYQRQHNCPPTQREIAAGVGMSIGTVSKQIKCLARLGLIVNASKWRGAYAPGKGDLSWQI
jgi:predicted transcriptional regulator